MWAVNRSLLIALCLLAACGAAPWARAASECPAVATFAPGVVSLPRRWEWRLAFEPARDRAYWASTQGFWPQTRERAFVWTAQRENNTWSTPQVASFSGQWTDFDPFVSPDGHTLFFASSRPAHGDGERSDLDLWKVERDASGWGEPQHLGAAVNADGFDELYPSVDAEGTLYFARVAAPVPTGDVDIWRSRRGADGVYGAPEKLGAGVNTPERWEFNPEISPDGRRLLFVRLDLPDDELPDQGRGLGDLYLSEAQGTDFGVAQNLGPCFNTARDEYHPTVLWESGTLYFVRGDGSSSDFQRTELEQGQR